MTYNKPQIERTEIVGRLRPKPSYIICKCGEPKDGECPVC